MPLARLSTPWTLLFSAAVLAACGGGNSPPANSAAPAPLPVAVPAPPPPAPAPATTISLSVASLGLMVAGTPRTITVVNTGLHPALDVALSAGAALPPGTTHSPGGCGTLAAGDSCVITITPGATPSAARGDAAPLPASLNLAGSNTNTATVKLHVLDVGSVFQGGYVFALDDSTSNSGSVGGKVAGLSDAGTSVSWSTDGAGAPTRTMVPGAESELDGAANTAALLAVLPASPGNHAAGVCQAYNGGGHTDWYLPALCEMGVDPLRSCGTEAAPTLANLQTSLLLQGDTGGLRGSYWTSSELSGTALAWTQFFDPLLSEQNVFSKDNTMHVRCVRAITR